MPRAVVPLLDLQFHIGLRLGDDDRLQAERVVRDGFARGQISLDELSERVSAIHAAETLTQLRATLTDLP